MRHLRKAARNVLRAGRYALDWTRYRRMPGAERLRWRDRYPCLHDAVGETPFDPHYFYQAVWAAERIGVEKPACHVDVGSDVKFVGMLTAQMRVIAVDLRPLRARLARMQSVCAELLALPFADGSIHSLSCLHVAEHIGLGRYGDALNPAGTRLACAELARVLAVGGNLFFSAPIGRARVCFNAHRVLACSQVLEYFHGLDLAEFSAVDDGGRLSTRTDPTLFDDATYACGLFWFRKT